MSSNKKIYIEMEDRKRLLNWFEGSMGDVTKSFNNYLFILREIKEHISTDKNVNMLEILAEFTDTTYHKLAKDIDEIHTITEDIYGELIKIKQSEEQKLK